MTLLSRASFLGMAKETVAGTYVVPTISIPFLKAAYNTIQAPLRDESVRNNDAVLQGLYAGPSEATWDIDMHAYPDIIGNFLRMVGPDTVTAATSTTLSASSSIGAVSISTAVTIPTGSTIRIDTAANTEYAITGVPTGVGPFTIPIVTPTTGLTIAHLSAAAVTTTTTHTFKQLLGANRVPSWSLSVYDGVDYRGWPGCVITDLKITIDPKGTVRFAPKFLGFPEQVVASFTFTNSVIQPLLGWQWNMNNAGGASTRGLMLDITLKRAGEAIHSSDGTQPPREVFGAALEADGTYRAIYESLVDMNLFLNYNQTITTATIQKPPQVGGTQVGGESLALTMTQSGYHKASRDLSKAYVEASFDLSGIYNATDTGVTSAVLKNFSTAAY